MKAIAEFTTNRISIATDKEDLFLLEKPKQFNRWVHGMVNRAELMLTIDQAEAWAQELLNAAQELRTMQEECNEYFEGENHE